jgi:hypothetical protein
LERSAFFRSLETSSTPVAAQHLCAKTTFAKYSPRHSCVLTKKLAQN